MKAFVLSILLMVSLSSCTVQTVDESYLRSLLGKEKREIEMEFGEPRFCKPDKYGEVCEFEEYRQRWNDILHLRVYFNKDGKCSQISTY